MSKVCGESVGQMTVNGVTTSLACGKPAVKIATFRLKGQEFEIFSCEKHEWKPKWRKIQPFWEPDPKPENVRMPKHENSLRSVQL